MTNEIRVFQSPEFETIRVLEQNGEPWFVAVDVCRALEISNSRDALSRLEDDEKMTVGLTDSHSGQRGGAQSLNIISEPGLYALIFRSRKPDARAFKRWVTHDVIPSIRKHGLYVTEELLRDRDRLEASLKKIEAENTKLFMQNNKLLWQADTQEKQLNRYREAADMTGLFTIRDTARALGFGEKDFIRRCVDRKLLYRGANNRLRPYARCLAAGLWVMKGGNVCTNARGRERIRSRLLLP